MPHSGLPPMINIMIMASRCKKNAEQLRIFLTNHEKHGVRQIIITIIVTHVTVPIIPIVIIVTAIAPQIIGLIECINIH